MNFEKLLAENMIRYGVKNVDVSEISRKFLIEQSQAEMLQSLRNNMDAYNQYEKWERANLKKIKVVKTYGYRAVSKNYEVKVPFFNNFVTIDQGSNTPAAMKKSIDDVLAKIQQEGGNLNDPNMLIEIVSTATNLPAGTNVDNEAKAAGRKKIDHDYDGKAANLADIQKTDPQYGNRILARKRGESAKAYMESKGVKSKIVITTNIVKPEEGRKFIITAKVQSDELFVMPVKIPPFEITLNLKIEKSSMSQTSLGQAGDTQNQLYTFEPVLKIDSSVSTNFGIFGNNRNFGGSNSALSMAGILPYKGATYTGTAWSAGLNPESPGKRFNPFAIHSLGNLGGGKTAEEYSGMAPELILGGIGRFTQQATSNILVQLRVPTSPLWIAMHGQNLDSIIKNWQTATSKIRPWKQGDANEQQYNALSFPTIEISKTFNIADLARAAKTIGLDASEQISRDIKYWMTAVYFDSTTTPPSYGDLSKNPTFFDNVQKIVEE